MTLTRALIIALLFIILLLQLKLWTGDASLISTWQLQTLLAKQEKENTKLQARNDQLAAEIKSLKTGVSAVEGLARYDLGMIKKGEVFYQVVRPE